MQLKQYYITTKIAHQPKGNKLHYQHKEQVLANRIELVKSHIDQILRTSSSNLVN